MVHFKHVEEVMGTAVSFEVLFAPGSERLARSAVSRACASLHEADDDFSTWRHDTPISRFRRGDIELSEAPRVVGDVLTECAQVRDMSGGWFDPWAMPGGVDPTGYVKGWAAQRALNVLREFGVLAAMVNAGGDVAAVGRPRTDRPWRLGLRDPRTNNGLLGTVSLQDAGIAVSGTYERGAHITDPHTREPAAADVLSAAVVGPDLAVADGLATGLVAGGVPAARALEFVPGYTAWLLLSDGSEHRVGPFPLSQRGSFVGS
ncbi:MAG TPA: FAD:protein FMN transferase [Actinomycetes bacterium]|nr:FAD:protein FMN transferase [Actinomycetes bacterium]